jgi:hypothetical protein
MTAALALALLVCGASHPNSISRSRIVVDGAQAAIELSIQAQTVIEELGGDADGDLELSRAELAALGPALAAYVLQELELLAGGARVEGTVTRLDVVLDPPSGGVFPMLGQWVLIDLAYRHTAPLVDLTFGFHLFEVTNSAHRDYASLDFNGEPEQRFVFALGERVWRIEPWAEQRPRVVRAFAARGARDASLGAATIALLVAVLCASPRRRGALGAAALAALVASAGVVPGALELLPLPHAFAGLAAALSAAYVATDTLMHKTPRTPWIEAGAFGLVHGLHLGAGAARAVPDAPLERVAVIALAVGAAGALLAIGGVAWALLRALPGRRGRGTAEEWLVPAGVRKVICVGAALVGFGLFARRAGFL